MANGKTLIRGAYVLTMDETLGAIRDGDVRIEGDRITAVGRELAADGAGGDRWDGLHRPAGLRRHPPAHVGGAASRLRLLR
jgi:cytosine/adenosine deaminase-related metal-dependent hydrolase